MSRNRKKIWALGIVAAVYTLVGFFLVPWLVEKLAVDTVRERFGAELTFERVAFNPYVLSLRIDGLSMQDPDGAPFIGAQQIYVNLQLSSLFRLAPTFAEIRFDAPEAHLSRGFDGGLNAAFLAQAEETGAAPEPQEDAAGPPRLIVHKFAVNKATLHWRDAVPPEPVETRFGPVNVVVSNLNTLPQREGRQDVVITTETAGTFSWGGTLQLNPLRSAGHAQVLGSHMQLVSAYIRHATGFEFERGHADVSFDYALDTAADGSIQARVDNFDFTLGDVLVRTFGAVTPGGETADRDVLEVPQLDIRGGALRWPEQAVTVEEIVIGDAALSVYRDVEGALNVLPQRDAADTNADSSPQSADSGEDWSVSLGRLAIDDMSVGLVDDSVQPPADLGIDSFALTVDAITTEPGARFPTEVSIKTRSGGTVRVAGEIGVLPETFAELSINAEGLLLAEAHPYLKSLADVHLDSGELTLDATVTSTAADTLAFAGDIAVNDLLITETDQGSRLGSWDRLVFDQAVASLDQRRLEISEIRFENPYADIFVDEGGGINLGRIERGEQVPKGDEEGGAKTLANDPDAQAADPPFDITVGRIVVVDAAANFADFSLPLPFEAGIADLNGQLTTIATASSEPSEVDMEGKVDEFGLLRVSGTITPLDVSNDTDIHLHFENVEIPKFSAYTVAFAGREIASGKLDLDLGYAVTDSELVGENRVVLRDFVLGDKVEHPGAMSLPLGLAVALLKGPDGSIAIDLPVRGNVDDPEFGYGRVMGKALANLVVRIVASPFALLGNLIGVEADELDHIGFIPGRSDLTPPEQERIAKIAEALDLRPELVVEINGVVDRDADGLALRTARLDGLVESRVGVSTGADASAVAYAEKRTRVIEALFRETGANVAATLDELKAQFTSRVTDPESGRETLSFDSLAYTAELRRLLIDRQTVTEEELIELATARAENVRTGLVETNPSLAGRVRLDNLQGVEADASGNVRMDVTLTTGPE